MKKYFIMIFCLAFIVFANISIGAQDEVLSEMEQNSGIITGIVVCPNDKDESKAEPIASAQILIEDTSFSTVTSKDGTFSFSKLPFGDYKIIAKKDGYYQDEKIVTLSSPAASITMTITPTKEKVTKTRPGKNITGGKTPAGMVFVAFAAPASSKTQSVAPQIGSLEDLNAWDPYIIQSWIAEGGDISSIGIGQKPKLPRPSDPLVPASTYQNTVMLFDVKTPGKTTYINLSAQPYWLCYNPATKLLYISNQKQLVLIYDPANNKMIAGLETGGQVTDMCLSKDGAFLYIAVMGKQPAILVLDTFKNRFVKKHIVPRRPAAVAVSPDGNTLYFSMGSSMSGIVYIINNKTGAKTGEVAVGKNPNGLCVLPEQPKLYVANLNSATVSVIDTEKAALTATIPVGIEPLRAVSSRDGKKVYVTCRKSNCVSVIDTASDSAGKNIPVGNAPTGIAISSDGARVYVTNNESKTISIIDTKSDTVVQTTMAQPTSQPWGIAAK